MEMVKQRREGTGAGAGNPAIYSPEIPSRAAARRANAADLAGSLRADRQNLKQAELELLFKPPNFPPPSSGTPHLPSVIGEPGGFGAAV